MTKKIITGKKREEKIYDVCCRFNRGDINSVQFTYLLHEMNCNPQEALEITRKFEVNQTMLLVVECLVILTIMTLFTFGLTIWT
jgi:hypothetical protein